jgi:hypothetical protein
MGIGFGVSRWIWGGCNCLGPLVGSGGLWSSCCSQDTATGARGWLGAMWGESLQLAWHDSDIFHRRRRSDVFVAGGES